MPDADAWSATWEAGTTPWDLGQPHAELVRRLAEDPTLGVDSVGRAFVPGSGRGHDASALANAGWRVVANDLAPAAGEHLRDRLEPLGASVVVGDALHIEADEPFDLVFDHTFFCAIDPHRRPGFGDMCRRLVVPGGSVISIVFPLDRSAEFGGPPWGLDPDMLSEALGDGFAVAEMSDRFSAHRRRSPHRWVRWVFRG